MGNTFGCVAASFGRKRKQPSSRGGQSVDKGTCSVHADIEAERLLNPLADNGKDDDVIIRRQKRARTDGPGAASTFTWGLPDEDNLNDNENADTPAAPDEDNLNDNENADTPAALALWPEPGMGETGATAKGGGGNAAANDETRHRVKRSNLSVVRTLGEGEFDTVYEVISGIDGQTYAMKTILHNDIQPATMGQLTVDQIEESILSSVLHDHPYVVKLLQTLHSNESIKEDGEEKIEGGGYSRFLLEPAVTDLYKVMLKSENDQLPIDEGRLQLIAAQVLLVLRELHAHELLYRDLKPENILLMEDGTVRLCDFGSCYQLGGEITSCNVNQAGEAYDAGTTEYWAPEQHRRQPYGKAQDIYSFGTLLYDVACQEPPFDVPEGNDGDKKQRRMCLRYAKTKSLKWTNGGVPVDVSPELKTLVHACMEPEAAERPTCEDIRNYPFFASIDWAAFEAGNAADSYIDAYRCETSRPAVSRLRAGGGDAKALGADVRAFENRAIYAWKNGVVVEEE